MEVGTLLERLRLDHLAAQLDGVCEQAAKSDLDHKSFLVEALAAEWKGRHQKGVENRLKLARFPWIKTLDQFDFAFQPSIDRKIVRELGGLAFLEHAHNVVLLGPPDLPTYCTTSLRL
jgi:DNA replication protein DnaC